MNQNMWARYTEPAAHRRSPEQDVLEEETPLHHECLQPCSKRKQIVAENRIRLGLTFCLWCGHGPSRKTCPCPPPKDGSLFPMHMHPCDLHNHVHPQSKCKGRCQDCLGCNQDVCTHFNPSGSVLHPDPTNEFSLPLCTRVSEDKTRCYRRRVGGIYVAIEQQQQQEEKEEKGGGLGGSSTAAALMEKLIIEDDEDDEDEDYEDDDDKKTTKPKSKKVAKTKKTKTKTKAKARMKTVPSKTSNNTKKISKSANFDRSKTKKAWRQSKRNKKTEN